MKKLILLAMTLAVASCAPKAEAPKEEPTPKKEIALQLYSLREDIKTDYAGIIKQVGEMGYTAVEAAGYGDGQFYGRTPAEFKADLEAAGMYALSSHTTKLLTEDELKKKDFTEALKWWDTCIADHKAAGMTYIVAPFMMTPKTLADLQTYCDYYNAIGKKCQESGISFGYHNHAFEFEKIEEQVMYDYMLEHTDPALVFFQMDVYWAVYGHASPVEYFRKYPNRFQVLHIKDLKELGDSGMVGFDAIFRNTDTAGTKHLIVEVEKYNFTPLESVRKSLDYLLKCPLVKEKY